MDTPDAQPGTSAERLEKFGRLLAPKSIAVLGGFWAERVVRQCLKIGYKGEIWPVTPSRSEMCGIATFPSIEALPSAPDAVFLGVNRRDTIPLTRALREMGAGGGVCFASGFAEVGAEGKALQDALVAAAGDMPVLGPNCYGLINYVDNALLWPDEHAGRQVDKGVAILMQSGNIAINMTMNQRGVPLAYVCAMGNQAAVAMPDMVEALADTGRVTAVGLLMEGIGDAARLAEATAFAHARGVPVIALKAGRSKRGAMLAATHTGSLAGADDVMDVLLERIGIARVDTLPILLETLKILHVHGALPGNTFCSLSCSGGEALLVADAARHHDIELPAFTEADRARIKPTLHELVTLDNPFDYHTFDWANWPRLSATFSAVLGSGFDLTALIIDPPHRERCDPADWNVAIDAFAKAADEVGARGAILASLGESLPETRCIELIERGIVPLQDIDNAIAAVAVAAKAGRQLPAFSPLRGIGAEGDKNTLALDEAAAKAALAQHGVPIPSGRIVSTRADAVAAAVDLGFPVAVKAVGADILHKTEMNALKLSLTDEEAVGTAAEALLPLSGRVLVERMAPKPVAELLVGVTRDPVAGLVLLIGWGGVLAELLDDTAMCLLPATREDMARALDGLKVGRMLAGWRGGPQGDVDAALDAISAIAAYAVANADTLVSLDVNPLFVHAKDDGVTAVDALIVLRELPS